MHLIEEDQERKPREKSTLAELARERRQGASKETIRRSRRSSRTPFNKEILEALNTPSTVRKVVERTGFNKVTVFDHLKELEKQDKVKMYRIFVGGHGDKKFKFFDLFRGIEFSYKDVIAIRIDEEHKKQSFKGLSEMIKPEINVEEGHRIPSGMKAAITRQLRKAKLPRRVVDGIRRYMNSYPSDSSF